MMAVMNAGIPGRVTDPRLHNIRGAATGMGELVPSDGGFLVQTDFATELLQDVFETGILASRCRRIPISSNSNRMVINGVDETSRASTRYGGVLGYWLDEGGTLTPSKPKFRRIELVLKKLIGLCYSTDELMDDAAALEGIIRQSFAGEFGFLIDNAIINGSGAGQPLGILNSGCLVSVSAEGGQKAATIVAENVIKNVCQIIRTEPAECRLAYQPGNRTATFHHVPGGRNWRHPDLYARRWSEWTTLRNPLRASGDRH